MKNRWMKKLALLFMATLLCLESSLAVMATETVDAAGVIEAPVAYDMMQGADISEEAIAASLVSTEDFLEMTGCTEEDLVNSEQEMVQEMAAGQSDLLYSRRCSGLFKSSDD